MSWRQILESNPKDKRDRRDKSPSEDPFCHFSLFSPVETELKNAEKCNESRSVSLDHLTVAERDALEQYIEIMTSDKFNLPLNQAEGEAMRLVLRARRVFQARQAAEDYRRSGYIKIFSAVLNRAIYLARNEGAAKGVPEKTLPVFLESDIEAVKGLAPETVKVLLEARILLGSPITVENYCDPPIN